MGKKKVARQTTEQALQEKEQTEAAYAKTAGKASRRSAKIERGRIYINASYNNTLISVTDERGSVIAWSSAGSLGFTGPKKATPFAAAKVIAALAEKTEKTGPTTVEVFVNGIGSGKDSALRSLANRGFNILSIKDVTPVPHNGPRPRKPRRI